jgi:hypothetical protein
VRKGIKPLKKLAPQLSLPQFLITASSCSEEWKIGESDKHVLARIPQMLTKNDDDDHDDDCQTDTSLWAIYSLCIFGQCIH